MWVIENEDPCDDWWNAFSFRIGRLMRHAIGIDYNPQFDLCDDCTHWEPNQ